MVWGIEVHNQGGLDKTTMLPCCHESFGWIHLSHLPGNMNATLLEPLLESAENTSFSINSCCYLRSLSLVHWLPTRKSCESLTCSITNAFGFILKIP